MASHTSANLAAANSENLHTKLRAIFEPRPDAAQEAPVCYSIEIAAKDDIDIRLLGQLSPRPVFCTLPWISDENLRYAEDFSQAPPIRLGKQLKEAGYRVVNNVSCYNLTEQHVEKILAADVRSFFIVRGDTVSPGQRFLNASGLVRHLRDREQAREKGEGTRLTIGVGGYPYGHSQSKSEADELRHLQEKIALGVDFLLTQTLYDAESFFRYRERCRQVGITIPVIPGIYVPHSYQHMQIILKITNITLSPDLGALFEAHAGDTPEQFEAFVVEHFVGIVRQLLRQSKDSGDPIRLIHFFTFNKFKLLQKVLLQLEDCWA